MPRRKKAKTTLAKCEFLNFGKCPACSKIDSYIFVPKALTEFEMFHEKASCSELVFCDKCYDGINSKMQHGQLTVLSCHLNSNIVHYSSNENVVPTSLYLRKIFYDHINDYQKAYDMIKKASQVLVIAGAGMSAESFDGATFRGQNSILLGGRRQPNEICYQNNPAYAWYYDESIRQAANKSSPHEGYGLLLDLLQAKSFFVCTSNIDGYFLRSGFPSSRVCEVHGSVHRLQCAKLTSAGRCIGIFDWPEHSLDLASSSLDHENYLCGPSFPFPACPACGGCARPNVSHMPDSQEDLDQTVKEPARLALHRWLFDSYKHSEHVLVIEIGCGASEHSLKPDIQLLLSDHPASSLISPSLITIDPNLGNDHSLVADKKEGGEKQNRGWNTESRNGSYVGLANSTINSLRLLSEIKNIRHSEENAIT